MIKDKLDIIYEDKNIIAINKSYGLLTVSTDREKEKTLFHKVLMYVKKKHKSNKVFIVNRLDKDTSGIVLFAKNQNLKMKLQANWDKVASVKKYMAVVEGVPKKEEDNIISWLKETKTFFVYSSSKTNDGKKAETYYKKISDNQKYSLLDITLKTGRKNQIRVHMSDIGCPVLGDEKYGSKIKSKRMYLHCYKLVLSDYIKNKELVLEAKIPKEFYNFFE